MKINLGYRAKLLLAISTISIVMLAIMTLSRIFLMEDVFEGRTLTRAETIGNILRNGIQENLLNGDFQNAQKTVVITAAQRHIQFVSVINQNNKVLFTSERGLVNKRNTYKDSDDIKKEKSVYVKSFPMINKNKDMGNIQIGFSLETLNNDLKKVVTRTIIINLVSLCLILCVSWFISGRLLRPILRMKTISEKIAKGDFSERLAKTSNDIIGELEVSLNNMATQLGDLTGNLNKKVNDATKQLIAKTKELEESNKRLKELDKLKSEFVSIVSHELRTPLTGIIGFAKTLLKVKVSDEQREKYLKIIESEGNRLATLIEEFLDISKIESGNIELQIENLDVRDIIKETLSSIEMTNAKKVELKLSQNSMLVRADKNKIKQVITNILNNALQYTKQGQKIVVSAYVDSNYITVSIKDEGPGISKEDAGRIFEKFYRGKDDIVSKNRGSGLGLAIAKGIIDMHKGKIWVESEPGKGSDFKFSLPKENHE